MKRLASSTSAYAAGIGAIAYRELYGYLVAPTIYAVASVFLLVNGWIFYLILAQGYAEASLKAILPTTAFLLLLVVPMLTMRLVAEERSSGTIELLMTFPLTDAQVVLGKYLATILAFALTLVPTLSYVAIILVHGATDYGPLVTAYLGLLLLGGSFIGVGILASALTRSQLVAGVIAFGMLLMLWVLGAASGVLGPRLSPIISYLSLAEHFQNFGSGVVDVKDIVFYLSAIVSTLVVTTRVVESGRWRE